MTNKAEAFICGIALGVIIVAIFVILVEFLDNRRLNSRAIEAGYAKYSETTGEFTWTDKTVHYVVSGKGTIGLKK